MSDADTRVPCAADVVMAYQVMLGRDPESLSAIDGHLRSSPTTIDLVRNIASSQEFSSRLGSFGSVSSPFQHFNACVDVKRIIEAHVDPERKPMPGHVVNFLGVRVPIEVMAFLRDKGGTLDIVPIPANFHADMAEWAGALRATEIARNSFTMIELGCGWGCWMVNTGVAARRKGLKTHMIGIEGDSLHLDYARRTFAVNEFGSIEYTLHRGIAAASPGYALFPRHVGEDDHWGSEPLFGVSKSERDAALASGRYESLPMVPLADVIGQWARIDLLHMDIQGGEADLVARTLPLLREKVAYIVIGTHSRALEGRILDTLLSAGWVLEIERPAIFQIVNGKPQTTVDGVQAWRNSALT